MKKKAYHLRLVFLVLALPPYLCDIDEKKETCFHTRKLRIGAVRNETYYLNFSEVQKLPSYLCYEVKIWAISELYSHDRDSVKNLIILWELWEILCHGLIYLLNLLDALQGADQRNEEEAYVSSCKDIWRTMDGQY